MSAKLRSGGWALGLLTAATAQAGCSRPAPLSRGAGLIGEWGYLSRQSFTEANRRTLAAAFRQVGPVRPRLAAVSDSYPPGSLNGSVRPLPP